MAPLLQQEKARSAETEGGRVGTRAGRRGADPYRGRKSRYEDERSAGNRAHSSSTAERSPFSRRRRQRVGSGGFIVDEKRIKSVTKGLRYKNISSQKAVQMICRGRCQGRPECLFRRPSVNNTALVFLCGMSFLLCGNFSIADFSDRSFLFSLLHRIV